LRLDEGEEDASLDLAADMAALLNIAKIKQREILRAGMN
jgi:hypothetical protein